PYDIRLEDMVPVDDFVQEEGSFLASYDADYLNRVYYSLSEDKRAELAAAAKELIDGVDPAWDDLTKIIYLHDKLVATRCYDLTYSYYSAYYNLVEKTSVCQGYAEAFWYLMYNVGIDCRIVSSSTLNHAWNMVKVDGKWYHLDATWDDPVADVPGRACHGYFLLSDSKMETYNNGGHWAEDFTFRYETSTTDKTANGVATDTRFDEFFWGNVNYPLAIDGSTYYYADKTQKGIYKANVSNSPELVKGITSKWYVNGESGSYWVGSFSGIALSNGRLYYNTPKQIISCAIDGTDEQVVYTLTEEQDAQGDIYGMYGGDGVLHYSFASSPNGADFISLNDLVLPIKLTGSASGDSLTLVWSRVDGAESYRIINNGNVILTTTKTTCSYSNLINATYGFIVEAYINGEWQGTSDKVLVNVTEAVPNAPENVTATAGTDSVELSWDTVRGAQKYEVQRLNGSSWTAVATTTATSYTAAGLTSGAKYGYRVIAISLDNRSEASEVVYATT
ncbi:MAG: transglutaminase domain-containing protein, partial [Oscillospiraceae bacterium]